MPTTNSVRRSDRVESAESVWPTNTHGRLRTREKEKEKEKRKSGWWLSAWSTVMKFLPTLFSRFAWHKDFLECTCKIVKLVNPLPLPSVFDAVLVVLYCIANMTTGELNSGLHLFTGTRRKRWVWCTRGNKF